MEYRIVTVGAFGVNCIVLWDAAGSATLVDPGADAGTLLDMLHRQALRLESIVLTHGHIDHISALDGLLAEHNVPVHMHAGDAGWAFTGVNRLPPYNRVPEQPERLELLNDGAVLTVAGTEAAVLHCPGHSPGSLCLHLKAAHLLLSGDTLFAGSVGRTDLPGGNGAKLARSLQRLAPLPPQTRVIPGHGPETSIATELLANPFLRLRSRRTA